MMTLLENRRLLMIRMSSPYSEEATEALKSEFTERQWAIIRDYGFVHPEIVGYMNAYAPEDAKIAYSLVPTLGVTRWMISNGSQYINTGFNGFVHKQDTLEVHCQGLTYPSSIAPIFGWRDASTPANLLELWVRNNSDYNTSTGTDFASGINSLTDVVFKFDKLKVYFNGVLNATATKELTATNTILLFVGRSGGGLDSRVTSSRIAYCKIWDNGVAAREMYPFIRKINGVDVC